jgi:hypothetical protein
MYVKGPTLGKNDIDLTLHSLMLPANTTGILTLLIEGARLSADSSEIIRVEKEVFDLDATLRTMIHLSITSAWPLFREPFLPNRDLRDETCSGAALLVVGM